jgi:hypothetical protein
MALSPNPGVPAAEPPGLDWTGGRTCQYRVWPGRPARRGQPAGVRAGTGGGLGDIGRAWAVPARRGDQDYPRRRLDRQHQPDARAVRRGRRLPDPAAPHGRRGGSGRRLAGARGNGHGGLACHAGRRAADCRDGPRTAPAARRRARRQPGTRRWRRHAAAALPGPDDQTVPRGADVVPTVAAQPERDIPVAAHPGDRQGGAGGDRRAPRARTVRHQPGVPRPVVGARRRARQGAAPQDHRTRANRPGRPAIGRGRRRGADRARYRRRRRPAAAGRSRVVLPAGGLVVDAGVTARRAVRAAAPSQQGRRGTRRGHCARRERSLPRCTSPAGSRRGRNSAPGRSRS